MPKWTRMVAVGVLVLFGFAACDSGGNGGDLAAFCQLGAELDEQDDFPTDEQLDDWAAEAPDEISDDVDSAVDQFKDAESEEAKAALFQDSEFTDRFEAVEAFEEENCGRDDPDTDEGDENGEAADGITPEFAEYCGLVNEIDESDEPPSAEQAEAVKAVAPEEIAGEVTAFADGFITAEGNIGAFLADPDVQAASQVIEPFEAEHCGEAQAEADPIQADGDEESAAGATVVEATALDYGFEGVPGEVPAGAVAISVTNGGEEAHEMFVGKLAEGTDIAEVLAFEGDPFEEGLVTEEVGGVFIPSPGDTRVINAELESGTYGYVCFIPGPDGAPHAQLGMAGQFTVA